MKILQLDEFFPNMVFTVMSKQNFAEYQTPAAKLTGTRLNDMLLTGPDLLANLVGFTLRFVRRSSHSPLTSKDCTCKFRSAHKVRIFFRFLWGTKDDEKYEYVRHVFGTKCSPRCANHAFPTSSKDHASYYPSVQRLVHETLDDFYQSADTTWKQHMEDLRCVLQKGGFNLTKWASTNETFLPAVPTEHRALSPADTPNAKLVL